MAGVLRREFYVSVQFLLMVLVALIAAFFGMLPGSGGGGEYAEAINLKEAWKNVDPYVKSALLIFSVLCGLRLALIALAFSFKKRVG